MRVTGQGYHHIHDIRQANPSRRRLSWVSPMTGVLQLAITSLLRPLPTRAVRQRCHLWHYSCFPSRTQCTYFGMMQNLSSGCSSGCAAALMGQERKFLWLPTSCGGIWTWSLVRKKEETSFRLLNWRTSMSLPTMGQTATFACSWHSCCNNCARTFGRSSRQVRITIPKTRRISRYWRGCSFRSSRKLDLRLTRGSRQVIGLAKSVVLRLKRIFVSLWPQPLTAFGGINVIRIGHFPSLDPCAQAALSPSSGTPTSAPPTCRLPFFQTSLSFPSRRSSPLLCSRARLSTPRAAVPPLPSVRSWPNLPTPTSSQTQYSQAGSVAYPYLLCADFTRHEGPQLWCQRDNACRNL